MAKNKKVVERANLVPFEERNRNAILHMAVIELVRLQAQYEEGVRLSFTGRTAKAKQRGDNLMTEVEYQWLIFHEELDASGCGMEIASYFVQKDLARLTAGGKAVIIMPKDQQNVGIQK
jgi:hypothetical protein